MKNPRFCAKILTDKELADSRTPLRVAGRWAAKEAIAKAIGIHLTWHQVEIFNDALGKPYAVIHDAGFDLSTHRVHISITHEKGHAAGMAVVESLR